MSALVDHTHPNPAMTQNASQHVLTKSLSCQRGTTFILTCVDHTPPKQAETPNISKLVLT